MSPVEWRYDHTTERWLRVLTAVAAAAVFGPYLVLALTALAVLVVTAVGGNFDTLVPVGLLALVGGPISLLYLWPLRDPDQRPSLFRGGSIWWFSARQALALAALGAVAAGAVFLVDPRLSFGLFLAGVVATNVVSAFSVSGRVDTATGTIDTQYTTLAIADIESVRTHRIGPLVVVRPQGPARAGTLPWYFLVPARNAPAVLDAVEAGIESTPDPTLDRASNRTVQVVAGLFALVAVGGGTVAFVAMDGVVSAYVGVMGVLVGGLFAFVAYEG